MKILVKFPTRERPDTFKKVLGKYIRFSEQSPQYLITYDTDDRTMVGIEGEIGEWAGVHFAPGTSDSKIHACNRGVDNYSDDWDILVLASDDMQCARKGWDRIIAEQMAAHFPDTDGVLHFNDGNVGNKLCTMSIVGRKYYDRFGYIYHPSYISLFCDNEFTEIAKSLNKYCYFSAVLFYHYHPIWHDGKRDNLYIKNDKHYKRDERNYHTRKRRGFPTK